MREINFLLMNHFVHSLLAIAASRTKTGGQVTDANCSHGEKY